MFRKLLLAVIVIALAVAALGWWPRKLNPPARPGTAPSASAPASFVNKVWKVWRSPTAEAGQIYVFLSDGTLLITSPRGKPSLGSWAYADSGLTMVEEGVSYKTDILELTNGKFSIRSHNPGQPVDVAFVPADNPPPPNRAR